VIKRLQVLFFSSQPFPYQLTTLGKFFTHTFAGNQVIMCYSEKNNRRGGVVESNCSLSSV